MKRLTIAFTVMHNLVDGATIHEWQVTLAFFATLLFYGLIIKAVQLLSEQQPNEQDAPTLPYGPDATEIEHGRGQAMQGRGATH